MSGYNPPGYNPPVYSPVTPAVPGYGIGQGPGIGRLSVGSVGGPAGVAPPPPPRPGAGPTALHAHYLAWRRAGRGGGHRTAA